MPTIEETEYNIALVYLAMHSGWCPSCMSRESVRWPNGNPICKKGCDLSLMSDGGWRSNPLNVAREVVDGLIATAWMKLVNGSAPSLPPSNGAADPI